MGDNFSITPGTGITVATKEVAGAHITKTLSVQSDGSVNDSTHPEYIAQAGSVIPSSTTMQNAAVANANGTSLNVSGYATAILNILAPSIGGGTTINFEASVDDTTWVSIMGQSVGSDAPMAVSTTVAGDFRFNVAGYKSVRARISAYSAGTITIKGYASVVAGYAAPLVGKALNSASFAAGDLGVPAGIVRNDNLATTLISSDGKHGPIAGDSLGRVYVIDTCSAPVDIQVPTLTASSAYSSGNCIGGKQTISNVALYTSGKVFLSCLSLYDKSNSKPALTVLYFCGDPTAATITNKTNFVWSTDVAKFVGKVDIAVGDWETYNGVAICTKNALALGPIACVGNRNVYAAVVTTSTPTFASTTDMGFIHSFIAC